MLKNLVYINNMNLKKAYWSFYIEENSFSIISNIVVIKKIINNTVDCLESNNFIHIIIKYKNENQKISKENIIFAYGW